MFQTIGRSFRLAKLCLHVLSVDKELVMFPVFSSIGVVLVLLSFGDAVRDLLDPRLRGGER